MLKLESLKDKSFSIAYYFQFKINRIALVLSWKQTTVAILTIKFNPFTNVRFFGPFDETYYMNNVFNTNFTHSSLNIIILDFSFHKNTPK
jgi:hypothetical protein